MNILITNDDGIHADGIIKLACALCDEHHLVVVAPDSQRSGAAHSLTIHAPLHVSRFEMEGLLGIETVAVSGTPADCVRLAVSNLGAKPDIVISGINMGANLGTDVFYSGTVNAAMEACILGFPAIALSICSHNPKHLDTAASLAKRVLKIMYPNGENQKPVCGLLNANVPDIPLNEIRGARFVPLCSRAYPERYSVDEKGNTFKIPDWSMLSNNPDEENDYNAIINGFVSLTPIITELCDYEALERLRGTARL